MVATYYVLAEVLETADGEQHPKGTTVTLSDEEAQVALSLRAVTPIDLTQQYKLELADLRQKEQELQAKIDGATTTPTLTAPVQATPVVTPAPAVDTTKADKTTPTDTSAAATDAPVTPVVGGGTK